MVPILSKWSGKVVGLTLILIGLMGIYECFFEGHHDNTHNDTFTASSI